MLTHTKENASEAEASVRGDSQDTLAIRREERHAGFLERGHGLAARGEQRERLEHDLVRGHAQRVIEKSEGADRGDVGLRHAFADQPLRHAALAHVAIDGRE